MSVLTHKVWLSMTSQHATSQLCCTILRTTRLIFLRLQSPSRQADQMNVGQLSMLSKSKLSVLSVQTNILCLKIYVDISYYKLLLPDVVLVHLRMFWCAHEALNRTQIGITNQNNDAQYNKRLWKINVLRMLNHTNQP